MGSDQYAQAAKLQARNVTFRKSKLWVALTVSLPQRTLRRFPGSSEPASTTEDVGELTDKIRRLENRQKRLEEALGVSLPSAPPSPGHGGHGSEEHPRDESVEGEGARYRLTVDEGGNVS